MDKSYTAAGGRTRTPALVRPFVIVRYGAEGNRLVAEIPDRCPVVIADPASTGKATCAIQIDHYRDRKTGPMFALAVCRCRVHQAGFTVYP